MKPQQCAENVIVWVRPEKCRSARTGPSRITVMLVGLLCLLGGATLSQAAMPVVFYDNFDDGNYDGWTVKRATDPNAPVFSPDVVASPEGYAIRGVGSGYGQPCLDSCIAHPLSLPRATELKIEMRAKSGPQWPNCARINLLSSGDSYGVVDYGEGNRFAGFYANVGADDVEALRYGIGNRAYEWHDFAWTRDSTGWWSLSIDGQVEAGNFYRDDRLSSFDQVGISLLRNQSEIDWVRVSAVPEPATMSLLILGGLGVLARRRKRVTP